MVTANVDLNFWEVNPELKHIGAFKELYDSDTSKKKSDSSTIMNAIYLLLHKESRLSELPEKERKTLIKNEILKNSEFRWDDYKPQMDLFLNITLSKARRLLRTWELKLEERSDFIAALSYDENTYEMLDDMMSATEKIWKQYLSILTEIEKEENAAAVQGGAVESLSERGEI